MCPIKLVRQDHLAIDFKCLATFPAGFEVKPFLHRAGGFQSFGFKGVLFARGHGFPEGHKRPLSGILFSECQTFSFGANVGLGLFLGFFGLLAFLSLDGTFKAGW